MFCLSKKTKCFSVAAAALILIVMCGMALAYGDYFWNMDISVTPASVTLEKGQNVELTASVSPDITIGMEKPFFDWTSSSVDIVSVDSEGKVYANRAGIAVVSAMVRGGDFPQRAGCTVTVTDSGSAVVLPAPVSLTPTTVTSVDNPICSDKNVAAAIEAVTPVFTRATEDNITDLASSMGVVSSDVMPNASGYAQISPVLAASAIADVMANDRSVSPVSANLMPIVSTAVKSEDAVASVAFKVTGEDLGVYEGNITSDICLIKVKKNGDGVRFQYVSDPAKYADKTFTVKAGDGHNLSLSEALHPSQKYTVIIFVKDKGEFDFDETARNIIDPVVVAMNKKSSGGTSGCSGGYGALALIFAALPAIALKKRG